jgi:hypothetical protein
MNPHLARVRKNCSFPKVEMIKTFNPLKKMICILNFFFIDMAFQMNPDLARERQNCSFSKEEV